MFLLAEISLLARWNSLTIISCDFSSPVHSFYSQLVKKFARTLIGVDDDEKFFRKVLLHELDTFFQHEWQKCIENSRMSSRGTSLHPKGVAGIFVSPLSLSLSWTEIMQFLFAFTINVQCVQMFLCIIVRLSRRSFCNAFFHRVLKRSEIYNALDAFTS